jgi:serine/threonine protein kinase
VALKVIKPGMDTRQVIARFEAERQALAVMDHPNIARVLDAGATESGRPFFVMDLVRGVPITRYCDENNLPIRERLDLFVAVCQAIQHAHTKGIIHRDIKPSNVLVTRQDGQPVVKVIDFGVAKAMGQQLTEKTLFTQFAQMVGTPLYMSPEQAELSSLDVDTRSDIYSLGVLLYELLTGGTPVNKDELQKAGFDEIRRIIREDEPLRPSTRISTAEAAPSIAAHRHSEPGKLARMMRGELDWIVMKCLEKARNRRYETASGLANDIECYLHDEPVLACPPSAAYRLGKFARRNKPAFIGGTMMALAALLAMAGLSASNFLIRKEQDRTRIAKERAERAQQLATARAEQIRRDLEELQTANGLIQRGSFYADGHNWARAYADLSQAVKLRPDHSLGWFERAELYTDLGLWDLAVQDYAEGFQLHQPPMPRRWTHFALLSIYIGDMARYQQICEQLPQQFDQAETYLEWDNSLSRAYTLAPLAASDLNWARRLAQSAVDRAPTQPWSYHALGVAHYRAGEYEQAEQWLRESLQTDPNLGAKGASHAVLAMTYHRQGKTREAREALERAADIENQWLEAIFRDSVGSTPYHWYNVGPVALHWWDWMPCDVLYREAKTMIDGSPPRADARLALSRARAFAELRERSQAERACARAAELDPFNPQIRLVCYHICADFGSLTQADAHAAAIGIEPSKVRLGREVLRFPAHRGGVYSAAFSQDGAQILSAGSDKAVRLWNAATGEEVRGFFGHQKNVRRCVFTSDGRHALSASWDWTARLWDLESGSELRRFEHATSVNGLALSPDGRYLATAGGDHDGKDTAVRLWDFQSGTELRRLEGHTRLVNSAAFAPNGKTILTGSFDRTARLWSVQTGQELARLDGRQAQVTDAAFLPDGKQALTCSFDWTIQLWDLETGENLRQYPGHTDKLEAIAVSPDGRYFLSADHHGVIRLWDLEGGQELRQFLGHAGIVYTVAFSPDSRRAMSGGADGTIRLWDLSD